MAKKEFKKEKRHKTNSEVRFDQVRVIGDEEPKIMSSFQASKIAQELGLDLILINESANPPVVRIDDYSKFLYNLEKQEKERKRNSQTQQIKEIQLSPDIADNDLNVKTKKAIEFLSKGDKVKVVLQLKGRQKQMPERGELTILKLITALEEFGDPESFPKLESSKWLAVIKPKRKSK
jgi:translation initiation factor IF-3